LPDTITLEPGCMLWDLQPPIHHLDARPFVIFIYMLIKFQSTRILLDVEVEAKSSVPKFGHLGQREPLVQPATEREEHV
jgi:hypothetical protein